jgi:hypothetical protein
MRGSNVPKVERAKPGFQRVALVSQQYGLSAEMFKKLFREKKLRRYKVGRAVMINVREFEALIASGGAR